MPRECEYYVSYIYIYIYIDLIASMLEISHVLQCNRVDRDGICSGRLSGLTHDLDAYFLTPVFYLI